MTRIMQQPTEAHRHLMKERSDSFRQFMRNGVWGTCVDCPRDANHEAYPEFCVNASRYDHQLPSADLFSMYTEGTQRVEKRGAEAEKAQSLLEMLSLLKTDSTKSMEFGDPSQPSGPRSGIRISYMNTAGGPQFRMCQLDSSGREASGGIYAATEEQALVQAQKLQDWYMRPAPAHRQALLVRHKTPDLSWFITNLPVTPPIPRQHPPFPGEVTLHL